MSKRLDNNEKNHEEAGRKPLPSLIYNEVNLTEDEEERMKVEEEPRRLGPNPPPHPSAVRWLWTGVICFAAVIILMWGWSMKNQLTSINWKDSSEQQLINTTKENWEQVFKGNWREELDKSEAKTKLQEAIAAFKEAAASESATTSSSTASTSTQKNTTTTKK